MKSRPVHESDEAEETAESAERGSEESDWTREVELELEGEVWFGLTGSTLLLQQTCNDWRDSVKTGDQQCPFMKYEMK